MKVSVCFGVILLCVGCPRAGMGQFPQENVQVLAHMPLNQIGGAETRSSDIWGWTDPLTGREYAIHGLRNGTSFIDITDPTAPIYLGKLDSHTGASTWRDMKVYQDHAYIVSDGNGPHGMQIFDLTSLRGATGPQPLASTAHYDGFREAHNIAINEESGYAYIVGGELASGGLHMLDLSNPTAPTFAGNFSQDGYTHDAQVVNYMGPDASYQGREIAFASNVDTLTIVDVTDKMSSTLVSRTGYPESGYTHQGWLSEDQRYFFLDDELDERNVLAGLNKTRTHLWDVADLDAPNYLGFYEGVATGIDHNMYVKGQYIYQANDASGLRVLKYSDDNGLELEEVAFLDTHPASDNEVFEGAWSVYPYFDSGSIIVSDRTEGLFVVRLDIADPDFDSSGTIGCEDIDALNHEIASGLNDPAFDLNVDGVVTLADRDQWLVEAGAANLPSGNPYLLGDADLNGVVDAKDFIIWNAHKFTTEISWCRGNFNADSDVDASDFIIWNANKFQSSDAQAIPEPAGMIWLALCCFAIQFRRKLAMRRLGV